MDLDLAAPPPTPIGPGTSGSNVVNEEALVSLLERSLRLPSLALPNARAKKGRSDQANRKEFVLDLERYHNGNGRDKEFLKQTVIQTAAEKGVYQVINHGIPLSLIKDLEDESYRFFNLPATQKSALPFRCCGEQDSPLYLSETTTSEQSKVAPSWEIFCSGSDFKKTETGGEPGVTEFSLEDLSTTLKNYMDALEKLASEVLTLLTEGLFLQSSESCDPHCHVFRSVLCICLRQPGLRSQNDTDHSHSNIFSIQHYDDEGGVHITSEQAEDLICPVPGSLLIAIGDTLQVWSNGKYKSVRNRPVALRNKPFLSVEFFLVPCN